MSPKICNSVTKDNGILFKCVSSPSNSREVYRVRSRRVYADRPAVKAIDHVGSVRVDDPAGGSGEVAYKYNCKPNYTFNISPLQASNNATISTVAEQPIYTKSVVAIDWLSITFRVSLPSKDTDFIDGAWLDPSGRLGIKLEDRRIQHYRYFGKCFLDGVHFGEISFCPHDGSVLQRNFARLKLDNQLFYTGEWLDYVNEFKSVTGTIVNNVTRLDIAIDYSCIYGQQILQFVRSVKNNESSYRKTGLKNLELSVREGFNDSFTVGKRSGNKSAVFYNKSLEIREKSNKNYITEFHASNGLDPFQDVYRFEIRLDGEAIKSVAGFSLDKLTDVNFLASLVKTHMRNWFEFVPVICSNVSRAKRFDVLSLNTLSFAVLYLERIKRKVKSNARAVKITVNSLLEYLYLHGVSGNVSVVETLNKMLSNSNLQDWFVRRYWKMMYNLDRKIRFISDPAISSSDLALLLGVPVLSSVGVDAELAVA